MQKNLLKHLLPRSKSIHFRSVFRGALLTALVGCAPSVLSSSTPKETVPACPVVERGEAPSDCPWADWVRRWEAGEVLAPQLPEVIAQSLQRDAKDSALHEAWGKSLNFDSGARAPIVQGRILEELARRFGEKLDEQDGVTHQHAGLIHTYGYLLSNLKTPFGYKRARWVAGVTDRGLGLPAGTLGPDVRGETTLLSRATYLFLKVALSEDRALWKKWEKRLEKRTTSELRALKLPAVQTARESLRLKSGAVVELVTDLVSLPADPAGGKLLVYSVRQAGRVSLITGFPVDAKFQETPQTLVRPRYNAWVE